MGFVIEELPKQPPCVYRDVTCDGCGIALKPVEPTFVEDGWWPNLQADSALRIDLSGGDGMAIDPVVGVEPGELTVMLCAKCTLALCEQYPVIKCVVMRHGSLDRLVRAAKEDT